MLVFPLLLSTLLVAVVDSEPSSNVCGTIVSSSKSKKKEKKKSSRSSKHALSKIEFGLSFGNYTMVTPNMTTYEGVKKDYNMFGKEYIQSGGVFLSKGYVPNENNPLPDSLPNSNYWLNSRCTDWDCNFYYADINICVDESGGLGSANGSGSCLSFRQLAPPDTSFFERGPFEIILLG